MHKGTTPVHRVLLKYTKGVLQCIGDYSGMQGTIMMHKGLLQYTKGALQCIGGLLRCTGSYYDAQRATKAHRRGNIAHHGLLIKASTNHSLMD